jgi:DNA-binding protein YbaB
MLQDLILAATNQALEKSRQLNEDAVAGITGGLRLPGFF